MSRPTVGGIRRGQRWRNTQSGSASARWHKGSPRNNGLFSSRGSSTTPTSVPPALDMTDLHSAIKDRKENFLMVTGAPGSGKTTRVPLYVEEICGSGGLVIFPKRLMATQSWSRLIRMGTCTGCEAAVDIGGAKGIGTKITFMTTERFIDAFCTDPDLGQNKFVILDEIHERDVVADICMYMVRHALRRRCDLKVLLMSATLDSEGFAAYFQNLKDVSWFRQAPLFILGGQQYDVKEWHLNKLPSNLRDLTSVNKLISNLTTTKVPATDLILIHAVGDIVRRLAACGESVLVFLPGSREILEVDGFLLEHSPDLVTYSMHSSFAEEDVRAAFVEVPRNEKRVILASSIAESSLTIPGVVWIVDCCISRINTESDLNGIQVFDD